MNKDKREVQRKLRIVNGGAILDHGSGLILLSRAA